MLMMFFCCSSSVAWAEWQPKQAALMTKWAKDVDPKNPLPEYPRPQMVREHWSNLNGLWDYAIQPKDAGKPEKWDGEILVPFPVESALSGVMRQVGPENRLWYRRTFTLPKHDGQTSPAWRVKNILLHLGAVDWETTVWINQKEVGSHKGGYDPFTFDITSALKSDGQNELVVSVYDGSDAGYQPRGKQVRKPEGIWYTPTTGIWQTVWLEPVPKSSIRSIKIVPDLDAGVVRFRADCVGINPRQKLQWTIYDNTPGLETNLVGYAIARPGEEAVVKIEKVKAWSLDSPFLYPLEVSLSEEVGGGMIQSHDWFKSYVAMRKISLGKDARGVTRMMLNNKFVFQHGPLDQGFWPDGLYTAPTDAALKFDIEITKQYGFNMIRKHVKVEPARWYYHCDRLGMLVWQDMPSGDRNAPWDPVGGHDNTELTRTKESSDNFNREWKAIIDALQNHPCIVMWVPFNEGWGQANTVAVTKWTKEYDPTRLVNCASGGNDFPVGDVIDVHRYPGPFAPKPTADRAAVLGEYGGLGLPLKGHTWQNEKNWGYRSFADQASLTNTYLDLLDKLHPMIGDTGLSAAIYTQTTDVEIEVNGLLTYDRAAQKLPVETLAKAHKALHSPLPVVTTLVSSSRDEAQTWQFTFDKPADGWEKPDFDASTWKTGPGGFGEKSTPGSVVRTEWKTNDIWLRRTFDLKDAPTGEVRLLIHHDEDTEVFVNGHLVKSVTGYSTDYGTLRLSPEAAKHFKVGQNTLAVHCKQTGGGQYIDVGFVVLTEQK
jgi:Glycosyl hydrolases family 2, TIM barrel domain/Glycosyl hydrolases family 2, sugar binding domain